MSESFEKDVINNALVDITNRIWEDMLATPVVTLPNSHHLLHSKSISAYVDISGAWQGRVEIKTYPFCAAQLALLMYDRDRRETPSGEQVEDCLKEVANMTGGNLKTVLPEQCNLTIPHFNNHPLEVTDEFQFLSNLPFICGEGVFEIIVSKRR